MTRCNFGSVAVSGKMIPTIQAPVATLFVIWSCRNVFLKHRPENVKRFRQSSRSTTLPYLENFKTPPTGPAIPSEQDKQVPEQRERSRSRESRPDLRASRGLNIPNSLVVMP